MIPSNDEMDPNKRVDWYYDDSERDIYFVSYADTIYINRRILPTVDPDNLVGNIFLKMYNGDDNIYREEVIRKLEGNHD